jgi:prepilin-type N-terminal cleavage/methylation domain-containing protein
MNTLKQQQPPTPSIESGFTLIECLLAIIIVGVLMVAIAPAVVLATATRLQARRVELATQAARTYVDGVRSGSIPTPNLIPAPNNPISTVGAPGAAPFSCPIPTTAGTSSPPGYYCFNATAPISNVQSLYCVNLDGGGCDSSRGRSSKNMIVQAFRSASSTTDTGSGGYILGVRVYRLDAFDGTAPLKTTPTNNNRRTATYTGGVGDNKAPLVELTTEIAPATQTDPSGRWKSLCSRLGGCTSPTPTTSPIP